ncbi:MAG: NUDIX domain-containing protein [Rubrivivax sp.]|nr:NUDIX domain-containing protein [Rubrivivax sp.]
MNEATTTLTRAASKAVPIVLRGAGEAAEILVFKHPTAGVQLVKGTIEPNETAAQAALRELAEESGVIGLPNVQSLGQWSSGLQGQVWHLELVQVPLGLPETWSHFTKDGGGQLFQFFWHPLNGPVNTEWHQVYQAAMRELNNRLTGLPG